jgi:hypothetical protein
MTAVEPNNGRRMHVIHDVITDAAAVVPREEVSPRPLEQEQENSSSQNQERQESAHAMPRPSVAVASHHMYDSHIVEEAGTGTAAAAETVDTRILHGQHYLTRTLSQQQGRGGPSLTLTLEHEHQHHLPEDDDDENESDEHRRGEKHFEVHPDCLCQLILYYIDEDDQDAVRHRHQGDEENHQGIDIDMQSNNVTVVPPILQHIGVGWEEYQETMEFFQIRLLAWKGRRILATMLIILVAGEAFVFVFFSSSGFAMLFSLFVVFTSLWITDFWLCAEMGVLHQDARLIFAAWKPHVVVVFSRPSRNWAAIAPRYVLKLKPSSRRYPIPIMNNR